MSTLVAEITQQIQLLSASEKNEILHMLLKDLDGVDDQDADEAWRNEVVRRVKAIHNGEAAIDALQEKWR
ncbi:MAG: addiction module protein [Pseudomonadota bacterium]|nr:addiction module protein [Pseudomonadota bacterium]